jgi:hypothetical protein
MIGTQSPQEQKAITRAQQSQQGDLGRKYNSHLENSVAWVYDELRVDS